MADFPVIMRAIPLQRYQIGEYSATLLGEIESGDAVDYRFILAFVEEGQSQPGLFVCCEREPGGGGEFALRVISSAMSEVLDHSSSWRDADRFVQEGLKLGIQALGLGTEQPYRIA